MKKLLFILMGLVISFQVSAQNCYWVFLTDKQNTTFDPYEYFDAKAIQRYQKNHQSLYDISNYPLNQDYKNGVTTFSESYIGESRWFNAVAVTATPEQIEFIAKLPYVKNVQLIETEAQPAGYEMSNSADEYDGTIQQLALMQGNKFVQAGYNGKGVRIAVLDGGFLKVNEHPAFKNLRDNNQIVKTWNFIHKKENVYNGMIHGQMVLSCIGGIMNDSTLLGLATGAEYLLANTEIIDERKKEEVWWMSAIEWADKNGADIVNSSVGFGIQRYDLKDMNGQTSIVAKAANMAARKGILVCNAMGNEGNESYWRVMVTPADADSVLSVGAVTADGSHANYSSFGPTADGRMKPNVVACGNDMVADKNGNYDYNSGTSFASPLVVGFAACVLQMHPDWTAMQLKEEIEKSANHYPYYDYAYGYGIPQAGYFTDNVPAKPSEHKFALYEDNAYLYVVPNETVENSKIFYNIKNGNGRLETYNVADIDFEDLSDSSEIDSQAGLRNVYSIDKSDLVNGQTVNIWYDNDYQKYVVGRDSMPKNDLIVLSSSLDEYENFDESEFPDVDFYLKKHGGVYGKHLMYFSMVTSAILPSAWSTNGNVYGIGRQSRSLGFVIGSQWNLAKVYGLGLRLGFGSSWYAVADAYPFNPSTNFGHYMDQSSYETIKNNIKTTKFDLEFYQRFNLARFGNNPLFFDTGIYGSWYTGCRYKNKIEYDNGNGTVTAKYEEKMKGLVNPFDYGVRVRLGFHNIFSIYGQYRISSLLKAKTYPCDLPKFEVGIEIF